MGNANLEIGNGLNLIKGSLTDLDANTYCANAGIGASTQTPTAYDQAATFNGTNQYLSVASNSSLQVAGTSFTFAGWVNIPTGASASEIIGKWANVYEYLIYWTGTQIGFYANPSSINVTITIPTNQWVYVVTWYDISLQTMNIQYNNGSVVSISNTIGFLSSTTALSIAHNLDITSPTYLNCSQAGWGFWKRVLTSNERTSLYNAGNGLTYSGIQQAGLSSNLVSYWALNQTSGASLYYDSVTASGNNLTPYNTPTNSVGPIATATASSQSLINTFVKGIKGLGLWNNFVCWPLRSSMNNSSVQTTAYSLGGLTTQNATLANAPTWASQGLNFNGTNQFLDAGQNSSLIFTTQDFSGISINNPNTSNFANYGTPISFGVYPSSGWIFQYSPSNEFLLVTNNGTAGIQYSNNVITAGVNSAIAFSRTGSSATLYQNATNVTTTSAPMVNPSTPSQNMFLGGKAGYFQGTSVLSSVFNVSLSATQQSLVYSLLKQTLAVGLSLP